jgi:hypothetical protein
MIYGQIATTTGYTFGDIDALTWGDVFLLFEYWSERPPTHLLVAAYLGVKPKAKRGKHKPPPNQPSLADMASQFGGVRKRP